MKIKVNLDKDTVSIKGMTPLQFAVIETIMSHVRLGQSPYDGGASDAVYDFLNAVAEAQEQLDEMVLPEIDFCAAPSEEIEGTCVMLDSPTLEVYVI